MINETIWAKALLTIRVLKAEVDKLRQENEELKKRPKNIWEKLPTIKDYHDKDCGLFLEEGCGHCTCD